MPWSSFLQALVLLYIGASIYSCGVAGSSVLAPFTNALQRAATFIAQRKVDKEARESSQEGSIAPKLKS